MRRSVAVIVAMAALCCVPVLASASDVGISSRAFLKSLGHANSRVKCGISNSVISSSYHKTKTGGVVEYNSSIMLIINENANDDIRNIAVTYVTDAEEENTRYMKGGQQPSEIVFHDICVQVMFALNREMSLDEARNVLAAIGLTGKVIDGIQRSCEYGKYKFILKLQPNGLLIMAVTHT